MNFEKQPPPQLDSVNEKILAQTLLHFACYMGDGHLLDTLIGRVLLGCNNNGNDSATAVAALISEEDTLNGWTPAHWAAFYGQLSCLMKLHVKPGLGFDTPSHRSNTSPLHLAAQSGAVLCLKWLLQCGASQNRQDFLGETPLHKAAKAGNTDCVAMLVGHGANLNLKNHRGLSPADAAEQSGHAELAQYMRRAGEQAEYGTTTKCFSPSLPISDLSNTGVVSPCQPPPAHMYTAHPTLPNTPFISKIVQDSENSNIFMNGEGIYSSSVKDSCEMEEDDCDMAEVNNSNNNNNVVNPFGDSNFISAACGLKRSLDEDDGSDVHFHKRRCFVPLSQKSHAERYGDADNNNIISSYNAVLAMRVEPMSGCEQTEMHDINRKSSSPVQPQSSMLEHQASLVAQQGYDSTIMCSVASAFH